MLARLQRTLVCGLLALSIAAGWWASTVLAAPAWLAAAVALAALNLHAWGLAAEFALLGRIDPGAGVPRPSARALLKAWCGEVITGWRVFGWRQPFRSTAFEDWLVEANGKRGVLLVHGFVCNRGLWNPWMRRLRQAGTPHVAINLEPVFGAIDRYVVAIDSAVSQLEAATALPPVIVAHSMGGLAIRAWLQQRSAAHRLHSVVTIGTPHSGTWLARFAMTPNSRQMREGNHWLRDLESRESSATRALFTCYYGHCDNIVFPARNAILSGAANHHHVPGVAHVHLVFHAPIFDDVVSRTQA